ncbi:hypothetical protein [Nocardia sp. NPDC059239]
MSTDPVVSGSGETGSEAPWSLSAHHDRPHVSRLPVELATIHGVGL